MDNDFDFEVLYRAYPRKEGKRRGMAKLKKTIKTKAEYDAFKGAMETYVALCKAEAREPQYIKLWQTFVNNWTDYLEADLKPATSDPFEQFKRVMRGEL